MFTYPSFNPIALQLGPITVYWYGIMYVLGFAGAWLLATYRANKNTIATNVNIVTKQAASCFTRTEVSDLIFYCAIGVIVGGRLGYVLFYYAWYDFAGLITNPLTIFKIWQGGMSFHGGLIGVIISIILFSKKYHKHFLTITDFTTPLVPIGLFLGRIGNFINDELWGKVTTVPWAITFPNGGALPRHPSQLYEASLEGVILFIFLWLYSAKPKTTGKVTAWFLIGYGCTRFFCEFFRTPDYQIGFLAFNWFTMGQLLSLPMIIIGILLLICIKQKQLA